MKRGKPLINCVTYKQKVENYEEGKPTMVAVRKIAEAIAHDQHAGDDVIGPKWTLRTSVSLVRFRVLSRLIKEAGGTLELTPDVVVQILNGAARDDLAVLCGHACDDLDIGHVVSTDDQALVVLVGVLIHYAETTQQERDAMYVAIKLSTAWANSEEGQGVW